MTPKREHAIVVGASVAGLLAARVLTEHFAHVTVVERDPLLDAPEKRPGVPQADHLHVLLSRGAEIIERLFPGIGAELDAAGAVSINFGKDFGWLGPFGWLPPFKPTIHLRGCSRSLLESLLRARVGSQARVDFLDGHEATDLLVERGHTTGLKVRATHGAGATRTLPANLVVEAAGRGSQLASRLGAAGYASPEQSVVDAFVGYGTCVFEGVPALPNRWKMVYVLWSPDRPRAAALLPIEGDRFILTCVGAQRDYPPADLAGFIEYSKSLRTSAVYEAVRNARPLSQVSVSRSTRNRLRHYDRLTRWPRGLVVVGDAVCAFNPIYGQGMTVAALEAQLLGEWLRQPATSENPERDFQAQVAAVVAPAWEMATGEDLRFEGTRGERPLGLRLMHAYMDGVFRAALVDPQMTTRLVRVFMMLDSPRRLLQPSIALQTLRHSVQHAKVDLTVPPWPRRTSRPPAPT